MSGVCGSLAPALPGVETAAETMAGTRLFEAGATDSPTSDEAVRLDSSLIPGGETSVSSQLCVSATVVAMTSESCRHISVAGDPSHQVRHSRAVFGATVNSNTSEAARTRNIGLPAAPKSNLRSKSSARDFVRNLRPGPLWHPMRVRILTDEMPDSPHDSRRNRRAGRVARSRRTTRDPMPPGNAGSAYQHCARRPTNAANPSSRRCVESLAGSTSSDTAGRSSSRE